MFVAAPSKRRPTWNVATVKRPTVKLSGSTCVSMALRVRVRVAREPPPHELAVPAPPVHGVGVDEVGTGALNDVACAVVLGRDAVVARPGVDRVAARTKVLKSAPSPPAIRSRPARPRIMSAFAVPLTCRRGVPTDRAAAAAVAERGASRRMAAARVAADYRRCQELSGWYSRARCRRREMVDATISRVRLRDLARPGRFRPDAGARSLSGVRFATGERRRGVQHRRRSPVAPRSGQLAPEWAISRHRPSGIPPVGKLVGDLGG